MTAAWGDGRVYLRGKRFYIAYYAPTGGRSREIRESAGSDAAANKLLAKRLREVQAHREGERQFLGPAAARATVRKLVDELVADCEMRRIASLRTTTSHAKAIVSVLGDHKATGLTGVEVRRYVELRRKEGKADATIDRELEVLRAAYRLAQRDGRIAWAPPIPVLSSRNSNARSGFIEPADFSRLLAAIENEDFRDFVEWFWWTAQRPGEIASLRWDAVRSDSIQLEAAGAKIGRARVLPLVGPLADIVKRRAKRRALGVPFVFHAAGEPATRSAGGLSKGWYGDWHRALAAAGLPASTLVYDLRRSAIRNLRRSGVPERTIMEISGHRTRSTFDRYAIVSVDETEAAVRAVAERLNYGQNAGSEARGKRGR